jgi:hypothetical protein
MIQIAIKTTSEVFYKRFKHFCRARDSLYILFFTFFFQINSFLVTTRKIEHLKCFCTFDCFPDHHGGSAMERDGIPSRHSLRCVFRAEEVYCFDLSIFLWVGIHTEFVRV